MRYLLFFLISFIFSNLSALENNLIEQYLNKERENQLSKPSVQLMNPTTKSFEHTLLQCIDVQHIQLQGHTLLDAKEINPIVKKFEQQCLKITDIHQLAQELQDLYLRKGYIGGRIAFPEQPYHDKTIFLQAIEASIDHIALNQNHLRERLRLVSASPLKKGEPLRINELLRTIDNLGSLPSSNAKVILSPGETLGTTSIIFHDDFDIGKHFKVTFNNDGNSQNGRNHMEAMGSVENLLGINDLWIPMYSTSRTAHSFALLMRFPYKFWNFQWVSNFSDNFSPLFNDTYYYSKTRQQQLEIERIVWRTEAHQLSFFTTLGHQHQNQQFDNYSLPPTSIAQFDNGVRYTHWFQNGGFNLRFKVAQNPEWFSTKDSFSYPRFILEHDLAYSHPAFQYKQRSLTQWSPRDLNAVSKIGIGGLQSIRGIQHQVFQADEVYSIQNELHAFTKSWDKNHTIQPFLFLDSLGAKNKTLEQNKFLLTTGFGINAQLSSRIDNQMVVALPIRESALPRQFFIWQWSWKVF